MQLFPRAIESGAPLVNVTDTFTFVQFPASWLNAVGVMLKTKFGCAGGWMISFSQAILTPLEVVFPTIGTKYVPDGAVDTPPFGPPFTVSVKTEEHAAVQLRTLKFGETLMGRLSAEKVIVPGVPVTVPTATVVVPVCVPETGLTIVSVVGDVVIGKLNGVALLSKYPWTGLYGTLDGFWMVVVFVEIWITEKTLAAWTVNFSLKRIPFPFTNGKIVS